MSFERVPDLASEFGPWWCRFSPEGRRLLSIASANRLWIYDIIGDHVCFTTGRWVDPDQPLAALLKTAVFSPDGTRAVAPAGGGDLQVYNAATGQPDVRLKGRRDAVWTCAWSPDGRLIAASGDDTAVSLWDAESGGLLTRLRGHQQRVMDCSFSPGGKRLASVSMLDRRAFVWDVNEHRPVAAFHEVDGNHVAWSSDGCQLVIGGSEGKVALLMLENAIPETPVVTAWRDQKGLRRVLERSVHIGCVFCRAWIGVPSSQLSCQITCGECGERLQVSQFTITGDWRAVAKAWRAPP